MQGAFLARARNGGFRLAALAAGALLAGAAPPAPAANVQVAIEVAQGATKSIRLRNVPRGTLVAVAISTSGKLLVALVSAAQLKLPKPEALFRGAVERKLRFQVAVPEAGDYYLVLDNRHGTAAVAAKAAIRVERDAAAPPGPARPPAKGGKLNEARAHPSRPA